MKPAPMVKPLCCYDGEVADAINKGRLLGYVRRTLPGKKSTHIGWKRTKARLHARMMRGQA